MLNKILCTSPSSRFPTWLAILALATLACATLTRGTETPATSPTAPPASATSNGLIAYLGVDGNVYTMDEANGNNTAVTDNAQPFPDLQVYQYPTWSPDGRHLAFISLKADRSAQTSSVFVFTPETGETAEIFSDQFEAPFYLYWSPDNESVSFLTSAPETPHLFLRLAFLNGDESRVADTGQPYYWAWAPDGERFFVHEGGATTLNTDARLSLFSPDGDRTQTFELHPGNFQAPAWSPDGTQLLAALEGDAETDQPNELALLDLNGAKTKTFVEFDRSIFFTWSPSGEHIAYLPTTSDSGGFFGPLHVIAANDPDFHQATTDEAILTYFWSPDSQKIAYFSLDTSSGTDASLISTRRQNTFKLALYVMDVQTGASTRLSTFTPTEDFLTVLPYFDQYHHSATVWSPDSTKLVYPAMDGEDSASIWVVSTNGTPPVQLADGTLAFWSWK